MNVAIEPIAESYADGFHACLDAVARERKYLAHVEAPPPDRVRTFVQQNISMGVAQFVAIDGMAVVGWCDIFPAWPHAVQHCGSLGMGLLSAYRGRGIGQALLSACLCKARANGITRVELEVRADNERALKLYERMGFVRESIKRKGMRFDGVYFDCIQMSLIFENEA